MKCGKGHDHPDVASVRACYAARDGGGYFKGNAAEWRAGPAIYGGDRSAAYHDGALGVSDEEAVRWQAAATRNGASREDLCIARQGPADLRRPGAVSMAAGGYALPSRTGNNDLDFWWVDRPSEGKWIGWTFVKRIIGGRPLTNVPRGTQIAVLQDLARLSVVDREECQARFGIEIGRCYVCGRTLTDEESRAAGIGPVCASR